MRLKHLSSFLDNHYLAPQLFEILDMFRATSNGDSNNLFFFQFLNVSFNVELIQLFGHLEVLLVDLVKLRFELLLLEEVNVIFDAASLVAIEFPDVKSLFQVLKQGLNGLFVIADLVEVPLVKVHHFGLDNLPLVVGMFLLKAPILFLVGVQGFVVGNEVFRFATLE